MAYSLNDVYRPLRLIMRFNALIMGVSIGLLLLVWPSLVLDRWGGGLGESYWLGRMVGGLLIAVGVSSLLAASERVVNAPSMLTMCLANCTVAVVLVSAYLQQTLRPPTLVEQVVLVIVFVVALLGAVFPLRYIRAELAR